MASFHTHIGVSSGLGLGLTWIGHESLGLSWSSSAVAGGLCALAGMMPDLDSDSGIPAREIWALAAAVVPLLLAQRLAQQYGLTTEQLLLVGTPLYLFVRFGLGGLIKLFTVHRGMFHSLPAVVIAGLLVYLMADATVHMARCFKAVAFSAGYLSHLILDEIWSVELRGTGPRLKSSAGTALKLWGNQPGANSFCYGLLMLLALLVLRDTLPHMVQVGEAQAARDLLVNPTVSAPSHSLSPTSPQQPHDFQAADPDRRWSPVLVPPRAAPRPQTSRRHEESLSR
ncbi:MAG: hydrolase [Planctomycetaceae bacterium]|nr:MAG: hydrolase [Planctomycetaceae bacterium]